MLPFQGNIHYVDQEDYDEFFGKKWRAKRAAKKASRPPRERRRLTRKPSQKEAIPMTGHQGPIQTMAPRKIKPIPVAEPPMPKRIPVPTYRKGSAENPITNKDLKAHKVMNAAMQNELETQKKMSEAEASKKKVEQEEAKNKKIQQEAGFIGAGKGLLIVVAVIGTIGFVTYLNRTNQTQ